MHYRKDYIGNYTRIYEIKEIETELPLLSDLYAIKNDIHRNKNTVNKRGEFKSFVKEYSLPYMMIIDYQIDFGLSSNDDPDHRKLVRTFLLDQLNLYFHVIMGIFNRSSN